jgi:hypothetical protein
VRILANENLPRVAVDALRRAGHDVAWVRSDAPGSSDDVVLARALREVRLLVTFDNVAQPTEERSPRRSCSGTQPLLLNSSPR